MLVLLLGGAYSFVSLSSANTWLRHTDEVRVKIALLRGTLLDAETGLRGYLLTGEPPFLDPYDHARSSWRAQLNEVRALTADNPEQQARLHDLEAVITGEFGGFSDERAAQELERTPARAAAGDAGSQAQDGHRPGACSRTWRARRCSSTTSVSATRPVAGA